MQKLKYLYFNNFLKIKYKYLFIIKPQNIKYLKNIIYYLFLYFKIFIFIST